MLMVPATPFEKFFSRWFVFTVVFLVIFLISYKLADYTRFIIYSLAYPEEKDFIIPVDLSHLVGERRLIIHYVGPGYNLEPCYQPISLCNPYSY